MDENTMGEENKTAEEANNAAETNSEDDPKGEKAKAAETTKKMAQRVADTENRKGARASTWAAPEDYDGQ